VLTLDLPAGSYVILAKATIYNPAFADAMGRCNIAAGGDGDWATIGLAGAAPLDTAAVALNVVHTFTTAGPAVLTCDETNFNGGIVVTDAKITAIEVTSLSNVAG